jgi:peptidoglycan/xylan/chitin deacetylase (PgdA/CDA1 family)
MDVRDVKVRRPEHAHDRQMRVGPTRLAALGSLTAVAAIIIAIVLSTTGGSGSHATKTTANKSGQSGHGQTSGTATPKPGTTAVPILAYHVINVQPPSSTAPADLYVPTDEFSAQMDALKNAGWHAVTLDQLQAYWTHGTSLGTSKPFVITFDGGYASQYTNALPVLKQLGWVAVLNIQVNGLSPTDGGISDTQVRGLISVGWQLGDQGISQPDLTTLGSTDLTNEVTSSKQTLASTYNVSVNWFAYPSGNYDANTVAAVRTAGFVGGLTLVSGWANPQSDRFRLPRIQVVGGTSPSKLLSQITAAQQSTTAPDSAHTPGSP